MFSALLESGKIISWGFKANEIVSPSLKFGEQVLCMAAHDNEFTAYLDSGRILLWNGYDRDSTFVETLSSTQKDSSLSILASDTSFALSLNEGMSFSWKSIMDNKGTHGASGLLSTSKNLVDIVPIPGGFGTLTSKNRVSSVTWSTGSNAYLENLNLTPVLPKKGDLIALYAHFENYETKPFPTVLPFAQLALIENPISNEGQWEYFSETGWLPLPLLPDVKRPEGFFLRGDTKIRFVPTPEFTPNNIPSLTIQRL